LGVAQAVFLSFQQLNDLLVLELRASMISKISSSASGMPTAAAC
jgi:hypothetical protein